MGKATDVDSLPEFFPAIESHQIGYDIGKCNSVKRIVELVFGVSFHCKI
jgi:hypothetical protein